MSAGGLRAGGNRLQWLRVKQFGLHRVFAMISYIELILFGAASEASTAQLLFGAALTLHARTLLAQITG